MPNREGDLKETIYSTKNPNVSSPRIVGDSSGWSIGKIFAMSLRSKANHRLSQVLRAMGISLAIGIAAGVCTCFLGPILFHTCLCCMGFRSRGKNSHFIIAESLQKQFERSRSGVDGFFSTETHGKRRFGKLLCRLSKLGC